MEKEVKELYRKLDELVIGILTDYNIVCFPIDLFHLAKVLNIYVIEKKKLELSKKIVFENKKIDEGFSATIEGKSFIIIKYKTKNLSYRERFTLAHEISHIVTLRELRDELPEKYIDHMARTFLVPQPMLLNQKDLTVESIIHKFCVSNGCAAKTLDAFTNRTTSFGKKIFPYERRYCKLIKYKGGDIE